MPCGARRAACTYTRETAKAPAPCHCHATALRSTALQPRPTPCPLAVCLGVLASAPQGRRQRRRYPPLGATQAPAGASEYASFAGWSLLGGLPPGYLGPWRSSLGYAVQKPGSSPARRYPRQIRSPSPPWRQHYSHPDSLPWPLRRQPQAVFSGTAACSCSTLVCPLCVLLLLVSPLALPLPLPLPPPPLLLPVAFAALLTSSSSSSSSPSSPAPHRSRRRRLGPPYSCLYGYASVCGAAPTARVPPPAAPLDQTTPPPTRADTRRVSKGSMPLLRTAPHGQGRGRAMPQASCHRGKLRSPGAWSPASPAA